MISFANIKTFFSSEEDRTVAMLGRIYEDEALLYSSVKELLFADLPANSFTGKSILLKPNFVKQNEQPWDDICLFTHPNLILATLKVILECKPKSIVVGDAPIQDCHWEEMLHQDFYDKVKVLSDKYRVPISIRDFRKVIFDPATNQFGKSKRSDEDYLIFDVADRSFLEPITDDNIKFRVTNYDPARMKLSHSKGMHKYCVAREIFESDIVITMPKTKTHRMACLTNSLKILVGMNGDKDYLPHHRIGSSEQGGDCYKDYNPLRDFAEKMMDFANHHKGAFYFLPIRFFCKVLWKISLPHKGESFGATWYGNDTVWRMVMDLNIIAQYGKLDGTLSDKPQRVLYTLCDGIVGGQNNGPLIPNPLASGFLMFSNDPYLSDEIAGILFKLNLDKIPLLRQAKDENKDKNIKIMLNGSLADKASISAIGIKAEVPDGWIGYDK